MSVNWFEIAKRNARSVQTTVGWIFWDPGAVRRYEALGLPGNLGYIAARCAPFVGAGAEALTAAFGSISPLGIRFVVDFNRTVPLMEFWHARDEAILEGLESYAPSILEPLRLFGPLLEVVAEKLPTTGRPFAASHRELPRHSDSALAGWHAINYLREWRGDSHWAIVASLGLSGAEASTLHNEWLDYDGDWLSKSRGLDDATIATAWSDLTAKGLAADGQLTDLGYATRQQIEDLTNQSSAAVWQHLGYDESLAFAEAFEPPCELLLARVNETAGERYQPASRVTRRDSDATQ